MDQHEQEIKLITKALVPTKSEIIGISISSLIFLALNASLEYFQALDSVSYEIVARNIESTVRELLSFVDKYLGVTFLTLIFWMLIGTLVYTIVWVTGITISAYKDDIPTTKGIVFPRGYKKSNAMHEAIAKIAMRTAATIILLAWLYILITSIIPLTISTFSITSNESMISTVIEFIASTVILSLSIFLSIVLMRLMLLRSRVFYK